MDAAEARACLRILLAVARADGKVDTDEARAVELLAEKAYGAAAPQKNEAFDVDAEIAAVTSPVARHTTFEAAIAIAELDGKCTADEHRLINKLYDAFELGEDHVLEVDEAKWLNALRKPRKALEKATSDFLHAVSAAQEKGDLTEPQYERLVADLRKRRTELLEQALSDVADA